VYSVGETRMSFEFLGSMSSTFFVLSINVKKTHQFKHSVKDDQIARQKMHISNLLILEIVWHVKRNSDFIYADYLLSRSVGNVRMVTPLLIARAQGSQLTTIHRRITVELLSSGLSLRRFPFRP
jgi:hypothetical protein